MDSLRVLVVDDEAGIRMAVERALRAFVVKVPDFGMEFGLAIEQAASGEEKSTTMSEEANR